MLETLPLLLITVWVAVSEGIGPIVQNTSPSYVGVAATLAVLLYLIVFLLGDTYGD